jgi:diguanylate cyclase (GGDEF)-like protein/PAS domain S-box-containing protein
MPKGTLPGSDAVEDLDIEQLRTAFGLQSAILEAAVDAIIAINDKGLISSFNNGAEKLFGYPASEVIGRNISGLMPDQFAAHHDGYMQNYHHSGHAKIMGIGRDVEGLRSNGATFPMHLSVGCADTPTGRIYVGICHDLTDYKNALLKLHTAEQRYREIVESQTELIIRLDSNLRLTFINPAMCHFYKCQHSNQLLSTSFLELLYSDDRVLLKRQLINQNGTPLEDIETLCIRMVPPSGDTRWIEWRVRQLQNGESLGDWGFQGFGVDITEKIRAKEQMAYAATHDPLTGLLNRKGFSDQLSERLNVGGRQLGVVLLNLDCFDIINETLSHTSGDLVLKIASERISTSLARKDLCGRLDADEFIVMLDDTNRADDLKSMTHRLQNRLSEPFAIEQRTFNLTACAGISVCPENGTTSESLMRRAESALREAKSRGRHELELFSEELEQRTKSAADLELEIRLALDNDLFKLAYQPKYNLSDDSLQSFEVLIRWFHPKWGPVSPSRFIPFAEANGLIVQIGRLVLEEACRQWREWTDFGLKVPTMAINISPLQLASLGFKDALLNTLKTFSVPASAIELEITEGAALSHTKEQMELILALNNEGFSLAIDDFGTGYSSLSQLSSLPASTLKIDRAFVSKITDSNSEPVIEAIIALGHSLGMKIVAEGVETELQRDFLKNKGCDIAQGFWYSRPLSAEKMRSALLPD